MFAGLWAVAEAGWSVAHQWSGAQQASRLLDESRRAADGSGYACALIEGAGLEGFPVLIVDPIQVAANRHHVC